LIVGVIQGERESRDARSRARERKTPLRLAAWISSTGVIARTFMR
jgi:hypothetical protein